MNFGSAIDLEIETGYHRVHTIVKKGETRGGNRLFSNEVGGGHAESDCR
jgi:hypothetical protein